MPGGSFPIPILFGISLFWPGLPLITLLSPDICCPGSKTVHKSEQNVYLNYSTGFCLKL